MGGLWTRNPCFRACPRFRYVWSILFQRLRRASGPSPARYRPLCSQKIVLARAQNTLSASGPLSVCPADEVSELVAACDTVRGLPPWLAWRFSLTRCAAQLSYKEGDVIVTSASADASCLFFVVAGVVSVVGAASRTYHRELVRRYNVRDRRLPPTDRRLTPRFDTPAHTPGRRLWRQKRDPKPPLRRLLLHCKDQLGVPAPDTGGAQRPGSRGGPVRVRPASVHRSHDVLTRLSPRASASVLYGVLRVMMDAASGTVGGGDDSEEEGEDLDDEEDDEAEEEES